MTTKEGLMFFLRGVSSALVGLVAGLLVNKVVHVIAQKNALYLTSFTYLSVFYLTMMAVFFLVSKTWRKDLRKLGNIEKPTDTQS